MKKQNHNLSRKYCVFIFALLYFLLKSPLLIAARPYTPQTMNPLLEPWRWTHYKQFSGKAIRCTAQSPNGDLWFGGADQIIRYDGMDTTIYKFAGQDADNFFIASNGDVYVHFINQLWRFSNNKWEHLALVDSMSMRNYSENMMMEMPDKSFWVCSNYGIIRIQNNTLSLIRFDREYVIGEKFDFRSLNMIDVRTVYRTRQGKMFIIIAEKGVFEILKNHSGYVIGPKITTMLTAVMADMCQTRDGNVWIVNSNPSNPILVMNPETYSIKEIDLKRYGETKECFSIVELDDGSIWISGHSKIFIYKDNLWTFHTARELNLPIAMFRLFKDKSQRLWVCTVNNDVYSIMLPGKRFYTLQGLNFQGQTTDNVQWFIAKNGEIVSHHPNTNVWTAFGVNDHMIDSPTGLKVASNDYVYVFGSHQSKAAISYFDGIKWERYVFPGLGLLVAYNGCAETSDGKMWFGAGGNSSWSPGTKGGLMSFDPVQKKWRHHDFGESYYRNTSMAGAPDGLLWIGCPNIARTYDGQDISFMPIGPSPSAWTDDLIATPQNKVWVAKSGIGTFQVSGRSWIKYTTGEGMISNSPTSLYYSNQGMLWVGSEEGICCYDGQNWISNTFISQIKIPRESGTIRESRDGALWINLSERDWYFRVRVSNQNPNNVIKDYIFKTIRCQFDNACPKTEFNKIETKVAHGGKAFFSWKAKDNWNLTPEEQMQFSYKLDNSAWTPFTYETNVLFDTLENGQHVLQVRARDGDLNIDSSPPTVKFFVEKAYWQQTWFILSLFVIVLGFGYFEFRIIQARKRLKSINMALQKERNLLQTVIDIIPDGIFVKDINSRKTIANIADMYNTGFRTKEDILGKNDFELFPKELAEGFVTDDQTVMQTGQPMINREECVVDKDGQKHWLLTTKIPLRDENNQIIGIVGVGHDNTEQKKAQESLQRERNVLRTLIDNIPDLIYVKDTASRKTVANLADVHNMGLKSEAEVLGKDDFDFYPKEIAEGFYADDQAVIQTGNVVINREEYVIDKQGKKTWLVTSKIPLRDDKGHIIGLVGIGRDITDRKLAEETIRNERNLLRTLIDNMPEQINYKDSKGRYIINNKAHLQSIEVKIQEEALGKTVFDFHSEEMAKQYYEDEMKIVRTGQAIIDKEEIVVHHDTGEQRWHLTSKIPIKDNQGNVTSFIGISRDITERKRIEAEREKLITDLQTAIGDINILSGLVPICSSCKKIRDDKGYWNQLESYIQAHSQAKFSHGVCPDCMKKLYPNFVPKKTE